MGEHQKLLDAARSAVDLLTTVLGQNAAVLEREHYIDSNQSIHDFQTICNFDGKKATSPSSSSSSSSIIRDINTANKLQNGSSADDGMQRSSFHNGEESNSSGKNVSDSADYQSRVKELGFVVDRKIGQALAHRAPSQVAKVTPQRLIASESGDDVKAAVHVHGSSPIRDRRSAGDDGEHYFDIAVERTLASSMLVLENAKLREELAETKTELACLKMETAMKNQVTKQSVEVQTFATDLREFFYPNERRMDDASSDDETDYMTTYSNSCSPDARLLSRNRIYGNTGRSADADFCTPASTFSTPGTKCRTSTGSSSGGRLTRRKLELPKALKKAGYMSLTSYEDSSDEDKSVEASGCCPYLCFKSQTTKQTRV